jgi:hypothetical protein
MEHTGCGPDSWYHLGSMAFAPSLYQRPQQGMGFGTLLFWFWCLQVGALSVLSTWVYNNTHRSILSAVFIHFMFNSTYGIIQQDGQPLPPTTFAANTVIISVAAMFVIGLWGYKTLRKRETDDPFRKKIPPKEITNESCHVL